jgi:acetyl esterase/lipase
MTTSRRTAFINLAARGLLAAVSLVTLIPMSFAVVGAYLPRVVPVGPFGQVVNTGLPWIVGALVVSSVLAAAIVALGGRKAMILLVANLATLAAALFIGFRFVSLAAEHGAGYDVIRAADGFPPIGDAETKIVYATVDGVELRAGVWAPSDASSAAPGTLPAVVFVHGGAFQGGGLWTRPTLLEAVQRARIVAIDIEYRLAPPPRWDQAPSDILCALAWVRSSTELRTVDRDRVVIVGESAGGNLAMLGGYAAGTGVIPSSCPELGDPVVPLGVVAIAPTADLEGIWRDATIYDFAGTRFPETYMGGTPDDFPDRYAAAAPFRLLRADLPPTLFVAAENDQFIHIERQRDTANRIRAAGATVNLIVVPYVWHGFDGEPNSFGAQLVEHLVPRFVASLPT